MIDNNAPPCDAERASAAPHPSDGLILVLQTGGLGDVVLTAELVVGIKKARPSAHVTLICKAPVAGAANLYPIRPDAIMALDFDPAAWNAPTADLAAKLRPIVDDLEARHPDVFIEATLSPSWFGWVANAASKARHSCCCSTTPEPEFFVATLLSQLGLAVRELVKLELPPGTHELERYRLFLRWLGIAPQEVFPWRIAAETEQAGQRALSALGFRNGGYLVCFPGGAAGAAAKRWPLESFRAALLRIWDKWKLPILLIGVLGERDDLEAFADSLRSGVGEVRVIAGGDDGLPATAALVRGARVYLGNDTGPLHLASAYETPGVAIYGGGHWPSYAPWAPGSVGLLNPLPCFGCGWDCMLDHGLCVEAIPPRAVAEAVDFVLCKPSGPPKVNTLDNVSAAEKALIARIAPRYRAAQNDRAARWLCMIQQNRSLKRADELISEAQREAALRLRDVHSLTASIAERDARIAALEGAGKERLDLLERAQAANASILVEAERRASDIQKLHEWLRERDARIQSLEQALQRLQVEHDSLARWRDALQSEAQGIEAERVKLQVRLFDLEREKLLHFLIRRLRRLRVSAPE